MTFPCDSPFWCIPDTRFAVTAWNWKWILSESYSYLNEGSTWSASFNGGGKRRRENRNREGFGCTINSTVEFTHWVIHIVNGIELSLLCVECVSNIYLYRGRSKCVQES